MKASAPDAGRFSTSFIEKFLSALILISGILLSVYLINYKTGIIKSEIIDYCKSVQKIITSNGYTLQDFHNLDGSKKALLQSQLNGCYKTFHFSPDLVYDFKTISLLIQTPDSVIYISATAAPHSEKCSLVSNSIKAVSQPLPEPLFSFPFSFNPDTPGSVLYPISQYRNTVILILTITSTEWFLKILNVLFFPFVITVFLLFLIAYFSGLNKTKKKYSEILYPEAFFGIIIGLLVTFLLSTISYMNEYNNRLMSFNQLSVSVLTPIFNEINDVENLRFEGFNRFFENSENVERSEFYDYASYLSTDNNIKAWGFISVVDTSERITFEYSMIVDGSKSFKIMDNTLTTPNPFSEKKYLYPVCYIEPLKPNEKFIGIDISSDTSILQIINNAIQYNQACATAPFQFTDSNDSAFHAFVFNPVFPRDSTARLKGLTFLLIDYSSLFDIQPTAGGSLPITLSVYELLKDDSVRLIAPYYSSTAKREIFHKSFLDHPLIYVRPFTAFGKFYTFVASARKSFYIQHPMLNYKIILISGLLLTAILSLLFALFKYHKLSLELLVRKRTSELRESEERFSQIAEQSGEMIWETDSSGLYTYVSHACTTLLGYREDEIIGKMHICDLHPAEERNSCRKRLSEIYTSRRPVVASNNTAVSKDGSLVFFLTNAVPVIGTDNTLKGYRGSDLDVTAQKAAEKEKEKLQKELIQAQKMDSIGRLAGGIAHDFNNMLCAIQCNADVAIARASGRDDITESLKEVINATERSSDLTRQLLAFARKQEISPSVLNLNDTISAMLKMLKRLIGENITLSWTPAPELWHVRIDKSQVDQLLANLVVNARDAIDGIGTVTIETANTEFDEHYCSSNIESRPGNFVALSVTDTGSGMDKQLLAHIFEPFFTTKALDQGTGLGLATVYGIVKQNGGFIHVYSELSKGTSFQIYLPRYEDDSISDEKPATEKKSLGGSETILIVEDEEAILFAAKAILQHAGYTVLTANSPSEALSAIKNHTTVHALLTDVILPQMNGKELHNQIREHFKDIKTVFMSGYTANVISHHGILEEGIAFLQKPFTRQKLLEKIRAAIDS
ncbi:MAG: PAS domain S-box protein [Chitinispirillaceae bacterium]|nr:PAS domain S-box protein [Chitinispirillaceae bacterium]